MDRKSQSPLVGAFVPASPGGLQEVEQMKVAIPSGRGIRSGPYPEICCDFRVFCSRMRACRQKRRPGRPTGSTDRPWTQVTPSENLKKLHSSIFPRFIRYCSTARRSGREAGKP